MFVGRSRGLSDLPLRIFVDLAGAVVGVRICIRRPSGQSPRRHERVRADGGAVDDAAQQVVLRGLQGHEPGQDPKNIQKLGRVLRQPRVRLDPASSEGGRLSPMGGLERSLRR